MAKAKKVAYVVFKGRVPGVYHDWPSTEQQVKGFSGQEYKGYLTLTEAEQAFASRQLSAAQMTTTSVQPAENLVPLSRKRPNNYVDETPTKRTRVHQQNARSFPQLSALTPGLKSSLLAADIVSRFPSELGSAKGLMNESQDQFADESDFIRFCDLDYSGFDDDGPSFELTEQQQSVVTLAVNGSNIFITGPAGSGKTVVLNEIHKRFNKEGKKYETVAFTGIAALPVNGRTIHSFAGWNPDKLQKPLNLLLDATPKYTRKNIEELDIIIIEEISMVESQMLDRLDQLFKHVRGTSSPFGGIQVIFLGDFSQLPPVKPFRNCLTCGHEMEEISDQESPVRICPANRCHGTFTPDMKWAFKSKVWLACGLQTIKLEQVHRQKDPKFLQILQKLRSGVALVDMDYSLLRTNNHQPEDVVPVNLMSQKEHVQCHNHEHYEKLVGPHISWKSHDQCILKPGMLQSSKPIVDSYFSALKNEHRWEECLELKIGSKVLLLSNLNIEKGLVNGSQGTVTGFQELEDPMCWETEQRGEHKEWKLKQIQIYQASVGTNLRPVVKFDNGLTRTIPAICSVSERGPPNKKYLLSRTQIPLTLAWAMTIHKSQGMTLDHVDVSVKNMFEPGMAYTALSRATTLEGLRVTGLDLRSPNPFLVDPAVIEFYQREGLL